MTHDKNPECQTTMCACVLHMVPGCTCNRQTMKCKPCHMSQEHQSRRAMPLVMQSASQYARILSTCVQVAHAYVRQLLVPNLTYECTQICRHIADPTCATTNAPDASCIWSVFALLDTTSRVPQRFSKKSDPPCARQLDSSQLATTAGALLSTQT